MPLEHVIGVRIPVPQLWKEKISIKIWRGEVGHMPLEHGIGVRIPVPQLWERRG